jgi:hypothetical protein
MCALAVGPNLERTGFPYPLEVDMFALLPVIGGVLAGWLAPRKVAIAVQVVLYLAALAVLTATAPEHGGSYADVAWMAPALAVVSAVTLLIGLRLGRRGAPTPTQR